MNQQWRVLDCSMMSGKLRSARGAIEVHRDGEEPVEVPVAELAVALIGVRVSFSAAVIHRLTAADVAVLFCDWKGVPESAAFSWSKHGRVGARTRAQASLSVPRSKNAWGRIVRAKVAGQAVVAALANNVLAQKLTSIAQSVRSGDPENLEAHAARLYWHGMFEGDFRRQPGERDPEVHPANGCLDYAYAVLRGHGVRAVLAAGLNPALGLFHKNRANNFALVDDLIEPFRPAVDAAVLRLGEFDMESRDVRRALVEASMRPFGGSGKSIPTVFTEFAQQYGMYVEGHVERLHVPTLLPEDLVDEC